MRDIKVALLRNNIIKAGMWYTLGNILLKGITFLTLPIFTRLLSTEDYGIFNTYIAYMSIISLIIGLGLHGSVRVAKYDFKDEFHRYLSSSMSCIIVFFLIILIITNIIYPYINHAEEYTLFIINILIVYSFASAVIQFVNSSYVIEAKYKSFLAISFIITVADIFVSLFLCTHLFNSQRYLGRIIGNSTPCIIVGILLSIFILYRGKNFFNGKFCKYGLKIGIPLIPHSLSLALLSQLDRIMIKSMVGASEAGIYSLAYTIMAVLAIIMSSLDNAWGAWFYSNLNIKNYQHIQNKNKLYVMLFTFITIGFMTVVPEVIKVMTDSAYWESIDSVIPLIVAIFLNYMYLFPVNLEYFYKKTGYISVGTIISLGVNFILNLIFIKLFGYKVAAYTTMISNLVLFIIHWNLSRKIDNNKIVDLKILIFAFGLILIFAVIVMLLQDYWYIRYGLFLIIVVVIGINYKRIIELLSEKN